MAREISSSEFRHVRIPKELHPRGDLEDDLVNRKFSYRSLQNIMQGVLHTRVVQNLKFSLDSHFELMGRSTRKREKLGQRILQA